MENKTFISIEFWQLVGFLLSFLGVCWGFGKMLLAQFQNQQAERQRQFETMRQKLESMDNQFKRPSCRKSMSYAKTTSATKPCWKPRWTASSTH